MSDYDDDHLPWLLAHMLDTYADHPVAIHVIVELAHEYPEVFRV